MQHVADAVRTGDHLPAIVTLILSSNRITYIESGTFTNLTTLRTLYVYIYRSIAGIL